MPVQSVSEGGKVIGYKYGNTGKLYLVSEYGDALAKFKALQQAAAIENSQQMAGKPTD